MQAGRGALGATWFGAALTSTLVAACSPPAGSDVDGGDQAPAIALELAEQGPGRGDTVQIAVRLSSGHGLAALQLDVSLGRSPLRYVGQRAPEEVLLVANESLADSGRLRIGAVTSSAELPSDAAVFAFVRTDRGPITLRPRVEAAHRADLEAVHPQVHTTAIVVPFRSGLSYLRRAEELASLRVSLSPGDGQRYGDADINGVISTGDALATIQAALSTQPLLTDLTKDYAIAANVVPLNSPGLGEAGDESPPGEEPDGSFQLSTGDALAIQQFVAGTPNTVVGQPIPGRELRTGREILEGIIAASRTLDKTVIYELRGVVVVAGGVTVSVPEGTRFEGDPDTRGTLVVARGGRLVALGTRLEPVVFSCKGVASPGCWGGLVLNGFSLLNNGITGIGPVDVLGCPERTSPAGGVRYGGCLVEDSSGVMRYVRVEHAGMPLAPGGLPTPALALQGVGSRTRIDSVQVFGSAGDGVFISGGTARWRYLLASSTLGAGIRWADGWQGLGQFAIVHQADQGGPAIVGDNLGAGPTNTPVSSPTLANLSLLGPRAAITLASGSLGRLVNVLSQSDTAAAFVIADGASCAGLGQGIELEGLVASGGAELFPSTQCADVEAFALAPARGNRVVAPGLLNPLISGSPDYRPGFRSAASTSTVPPPTDPFFDATATHAGAVAPANGGATNVPWYAGWTRGWTPAP